MCGGGGGGGRVNVPFHDFKHREREILYLNYSKKTPVTITVVYVIWIMLELIYEMKIRQLVVKHTDVSLVVNTRWSIYLLACVTISK